MKISINDIATQVEATDMARLAASLDLPQRGVAVAVNNRIVPRQEWEATPLAEGDRVTIIKAAFGG